MARNPQPRGRRRDPQVDERIRVAAHQLLASDGYGGLTVDAVATRAGVGKAAIYRRYGSKAEMAFAAVVHDVDIEPPEDTGSLEGDLVALTETIRSRIADPIGIQVAPALIADIDRDPELKQRLEATFFAAEKRDFTTLLDRAVQRGELRHAVEPELLHMLVVGPFFAAAYGYHEPIDPTGAAQIAHIITVGLTANSNRGSGARASTDLPV